MTDEHPNRAFEAPPDDERLLDLLVDNELSLEERRELLARLDEQPAGWRRCALAFLEAQAWQTELPEMARPAQTAVPAETYPRRGGSFGWSNYLTLAASFLLAFGLGLWMRGAGTETPVNPSGKDLAQSPKATVGETQLVSDGLAGALTLPGSEQPVPVYAGRGYDEQWVRNQPSAVPDSLVQSLEQMGHAVQRNRRLVPVDLEDGRRVIVPVDQVDVQFTRGRGFQ